MPAPGAAFTRWTDALIGGAVALVAATVVPAAPLRRPREQAAAWCARSRTCCGRGRRDGRGRGRAGAALLEEARATDQLIRELQDAADEGLAVVASSPFRMRHGRAAADGRSGRPLDRALRARGCWCAGAVAAYRRRPCRTPTPWSRRELAAAVEVVANELDANRMAVGGPPALIAVGAPPKVERTRTSPPRWCSPRSARSSPTCC